MPTHREDMELRHWICDPARHRRAQVDEALANPTAEFLGRQVEVVVTDPGEEWVCDWCSATIPIPGPFGPEGWVPALGGDAICPRCTEEQLHGNEKVILETFPREPHFWSLRGCGCQPCREEVDRWKEQRQATRSGDASSAN